MSARKQHDNKHRTPRTQHRPLEHLPQHRVDELVEYLCEADAQFLANWRGAIRMKASDATKHTLILWAMRANERHLAWFHAGQAMPLINHPTIVQERRAA